MERCRGPGRYGCGGETESGVRRRYGPRVSTGEAVAWRYGAVATRSRVERFLDRPGRFAVRLRQGMPGLESTAGAGAARCRTPGSTGGDACTCGWQPVIPARAPRRRIRSGRALRGAGRYAGRMLFQALAWIESEHEGLDERLPLLAKALGGPVLDRATDPFHPPLAVQRVRQPRGARAPGALPLGRASAAIGRADPRPLPPGTRPRRQAGEHAPLLRRRPLAGAKPAGARSPPRPAPPGPRGPGAGPRGKGGRGGAEPRGERDLRRRLKRMAPHSSAAAPPGRRRRERAVPPPRPRRRAP